MADYQALAGLFGKTGNPKETRNGLCANDITSTVTALRKRGPALRQSGTGGMQGGRVEVISLIVRRLQNNLPEKLAHRDFSVEKSVLNKSFHVRKL